MQVETHGAGSAEESEHRPKPGKHRAQESVLVYIKTYAVTPLCYFSYSVPLQIQVVKLKLNGTTHKEINFEIQGKTVSDIFHSIYLGRTQQLVSEARYYN